VVLSGVPWPLLTGGAGSSLLTPELGFDCSISRKLWSAMLDRSCLSTNQGEVAFITSACRGTAGASARNLSAQGPAESFAPAVSFAICGADDAHVNEVRSRPTRQKM